MFFLPNYKSLRSESAPPSGKNCKETILIESREQDKYLIILCETNHIDHKLAASKITYPISKKKKTNKYNYIFNNIHIFKCICICNVYFLFFKGILQLGRGGLNRL